MKFCKKIIFLVLVTLLSAVIVLSTESSGAVKPTPKSSTTHTAELLTTKSFKTNPTTTAGTVSPSNPPTTQTPYRTTTRSHYESTFQNIFCNFTACKLPDCHCLSDLPPSGLQINDIPQFVLITFDGAVTVTNFPYYQQIMEHKNPNGCPSKSTYFVSHVDTNYKLVHELHRHGNEIGVHSISKSKNNFQQYWKDLNYEGWKWEFGGQRRILSKFAEIPIEEIRGARAPNLQTAGNLTFTALAKEGFEYDCSNPSRKGIKSPFFPHTLDYGFQRPSDCQVAPCLEIDQKYKGFWEVPMNDWDGLSIINHETFHRECAVASACIFFNSDGSVNYKPTVDQIYNLFESNFKRYYEGNRAPFPLFLSEEWMQNESRREGLFKFLKMITTKSDVFAVSIHEIIEWMKHPSRTSEYVEKSKSCKPVKQTTCGLKNGEKIESTTQFLKKCDYINVNELGGLTKRMVICDDETCPHDYPWVNREGI